MFIGRHRELALLNNAWQSGKPELVKQLRYKPQAG